MADANVLTEKALEILNQTQPDPETVGVVAKFVTRIPLSFMQLAQLSIWALVSLAIVTFVIKKFIIDSISGLVIPEVLKWIFSLTISLFTATFWLPIVLPFILEIIMSVGG
ncbi:MAG: hypothetical protein ACTSYD_02035 [Candidatus Heimdallarchaeaceae archaeon]